LIEELKLAAEKPTHDTAKTTDSEEVLQLHEQMTELHAQMTAMENQNMETVALLKQENRKLIKQCKSVEAGGDKASTTAKGSASSKISQREIAALTVEHEMLQAKVAELNQFLLEHPEPGMNANNSDPGASAQEVEEL